MLQSLFVFAFLDDDVAVDVDVLEQQQKHEEMIDDQYLRKGRNHNSEKHRWV